MFDKDQDGYITPRDVGWVLRGLGQTPTEADLKQIIKDVDTKGRNKLNERQIMASRNTGRCSAAAVPLDYIFSDI